MLSENTGHLDLTDEARSFVLHRQRSVDAELLATDGWGETDVDELVACMEAAYQNRENARARGQAGADFMRTWSWPAQIDQLLSKLEKFE